MISKYAKKSQWDVGGSNGFVSSTEVNDGKTAYNSSTTFSFQPYGAYFVIDGLKLGIQYEQKTYNPSEWNGDRNGMNNIKVNLGFNVFFF